MNISIVIPAFNEEKLLPRTLDAVRTAMVAFTSRGWPVEVIVCDNNSTDRTSAIAREHGARVVFEPVNQISRARNAGASVATGDWLLFLDADSIPTRELLDDAAEALGDARVMYLGACVGLDQKLKPGMQLFLRGWNFISRLFGWMAGSFVMVETAAFREVGGFSHLLYAGEEVDLSRRLKALARRKGRRVLILSKHPLVSSARRMNLYPRLHIARFAIRAILRPKATPASREACAMWYDGKR